MTDERGSIELQVVEQRDHVTPMGIGRGQFAGSGRGEPETTRVVGNTRVPVTEVRHLLPPMQMSALAAMSEHDRGAGAVDLVVKGGAVEYERGHGATLVGPPVNMRVGTRGSNG